MGNDNLRSLCENVSCNSEKRFVGIDFSSKSKKIYFPLGYRIPDNDYDCRLSILKLIKTLFKTEYNGYDFGNNIGDSFEIPVNSYLRIINDYLSNGLYHNIEKEFIQRQSGKINWKRTLRTENYISNGNLVFLKPFVERKTNENNIITSIHAFCVKKSIEEIGWLFGNIRIPFYGFSESNIKSYIRILNQELSKTFDDRKKTLIIHMKRIIEESTDEENNIANKKYGTESYENNWEYMVNEVFGNRNPEDFFPGTSWHIEGKTYNNSKLRPDTILAYKENLYIIDSKYYRFGITGDPRHLPQSDSIQKQITYGDYVENNKNYSAIYNAFVLPYNRENNPFNISGNIEYFGFSKSDWRSKEKKNYEHVALILMDTKYLIDCYFGNDEKEIENLVKSIENILTTYNE